eukprot:Skav232487  [mRNA]  locus=scaffold2877:336337:337574:- [translate_table: standard]
MKPGLDTVVPALAATVERLEALQHRCPGENGPGQRLREAPGAPGSVAVAASLRQRLAEFEDLAPDRALGAAGPQSTAELLAHWRKEVRPQRLGSPGRSFRLSLGGRRVARSQEAQQLVQRIKGLKGRAQICQERQRSRLQAAEEQRKELWTQLVQAPPVLVGGAWDGTRGIWRLKSDTM